MSKRVEANITCPKCSSTFDYTLFRSIWGEYPENRELVMSDRVNVASCPVCEFETKLEFSLFYTNSAKKFAVWWEPYHDPHVDTDAAAYQNMGEGNYLAAAPRIRDWNEFKETILKFERGKMKGKAFAADDMDQMMKGLMELVRTQKNPERKGCFSVFVIFLLVICVAALSAAHYP